MIQSYRCKDFAITERENYTGNQVAHMQFLCVLCAFAVKKSQRKDAKFYPLLTDRKTIYHLADFK